MPVPEAATLRWSPAQQSMLRELGCELFSVRGAASDATVPARGNAFAQASLNADHGARPTAHADATADARSPTHADAAAYASDRARAGAATRSRPAGVAPPTRQLLVVLAPDSNWLRGPHAKLARGVLAALGIDPSNVRGEPIPGAPALAFGIDAPDALRAPSLDALRDARAKRALWPALRGLRRRLRDADARA